GQPSPSLAVARPSARPTSLAAARVPPVATSTAAGGPCPGSWGPRRSRGGGPRRPGCSAAVAGRREAVGQARLSALGELAAQAGAGASDDAAPGPADYPARPGPYHPLG